MMTTLVGYVFKGAIRDRLFITLAILLVLSIALSFFFASAAFIEKSQYAVVFTSSGVRIAGSLLLAVFVSFFVRKSFDNKDVELLLTRPISRKQFYMSYVLAFIAIAIILACGQFLAIWATNPSAQLSKGYLIWLVGIGLENIFVVSAAMFFAMVLKNAVSSMMACFGLYVLSRLIGEIIGIALSGVAAGGVNSTLSVVIQAISIVIPRLDLIAQGEWLVYQEGPLALSQGDFVLIFLQIPAIALLLIIAGMIDLVRKQF